MPLNLDSCITGVFVPGNIGASSGQTPVVREMPQRAPTVIVAAIIEAAVATDAVIASSGYGVAVVEPASAVDAPNATITGAPFVTVTWEAATVTSVTLSGGNLVATNTGTSATSQGAHVVSTSGKTSGKYYFEDTLTTIVGAGGANYGIGVGTTASTYTNMGNAATTGVMMFRSGSIYSNGTNTGTTLGSRSSGNVIGVAVDLDNRKVWYRVAPSGNWNNSGSADPATNVGGITIPAGTMIPFATFGGTGGAASNVQTTNFGASAFTGAVPSGFTAGWPT